MIGLDRRFDVPISWEVNEQLGTYATLYRHLMERIGVEETTAIWNALPAEPDDLMKQILAYEVGKEEEPCASDELTEEVQDIFASPLRGVDAESAGAFLLSHPPFSWLQEAQSELQGVLSLTTYEALHLFRDALARICEETIARFGKAGELMVYDALNEEWRSVITEKMPGADFMKRRLARYKNPPKTLDIFGAGLDVELKSGDEKEILAHVTTCEWARYFLERHPSVGYLLACSVDDPVYRLQTDGVRFQRRCTLMEGGEYCEFRFYAVDETGPDA